MKIDEKEKDKEKERDKDENSLIHEFMIKQPNNTQQHTQQHTQQEKFRPTDNTSFLEWFCAPEQK